MSRRFSILPVFLLAAIALAALTGCMGSARPKGEVRLPRSQGSSRVSGPAAGGSMTGEASYYGGKFHGRVTASGEKFDKNALTAAHHTLPFGTRLLVTNVENGKSVVVRVNDRYPGTKRVIDLSEGSFKRLAPLEQGVIPVKLEKLN